MEPEVAPLAREAAALEMLRHTMNRQPGSALSRSYGQHPHLGVYADLFGALAAARCYRLRPGTPEATAAAVLETLNHSTAPCGASGIDEEMTRWKRAVVS
jgi:hypothetical protein